MMTHNLYLMDRDISTFLSTIKFRGIMTIMGFRKTTGSQEVPWPTKNSLLESFNKPNNLLTEEEFKRMKNPSKLTVGARALCKHAHRSSEGFWGNPKGTEVEKNEMANGVAEKIIGEAVWINLHLLPHQEYIIELRNEKSYGIRWTLDTMFRGFLEPQMEGGHSKKWKH